MNCPGHRHEPLISGDALVITEIDLLQNNGQLKTGKREIEANLRDVASGLARVVFHDLRSSKAPRQSSRSVAVLLQLLRIASIDPLGKRGAKVGE